MMRDKHIHIPKHNELFKNIHKQISEKLIINKKHFLIKLWFKFFFYFSFLILAYSLLFIVEQPILFVGIFILYGFISLLIAFNFAHDLSHNTVFKSKKLNNFFYVFTFTIVGAHADAWKKRHVNSHHYAPNVKDYDSDLKITKLIRVIPNSEYYWFHKFQHLYAPIAYTTYSLFWVFIKDFVILFSKDENSPKKGFSYHLLFWAQKAIYILLLIIFPILFSNQTGLIVFIGFLLMHLVQSLFLLFTFFMTHHVEETEYPTTDENGKINTSWMMNQIISSNDMHPFSTTANFILGGFNNHIAHHLFPHIHHIHYPQLNRVLYDILLQNNIKPNQTS
jgi:linoleoyl-CoA desaturase